jgi:NADPH:quinone reductase-like Zn-dependent oxidoreductase
MRAAVIHRFGGPERVVIEERPRPVPKKNEVLIRVHASTVSIADYRVRTKDLPKGLGFFGPLALGVFRPRRPVLGMDVAGAVEQVGSAVTRFAVGDRVIAMPGARFGGHAEYLAMQQDAALAHAPKGWSHENAVSILFGGVTALTFLRLYPLAAGMRVLINGASGATGSSAVQIAKHYGAHVTGITTHGDVVMRLGADEVIDYRREDFTALGRQWDVVFDCVGNAPFERVSSSIRQGGALLMVISDLRGMLAARRNSRRLGGVVSNDNRAATAADLELLAALAEDGSLRPVIERVYEFDEIREAHARVGENRKVGNLVLRVSP